MYAQAIETGTRVGAEVYGVDYQPSPVDIRLEKPKHNLLFGIYELKTLQIPGHTQGSIAVYADVANKRICLDKVYTDHMRLHGEVTQAKQPPHLKELSTSRLRYYAKDIFVYISPPVRQESL